MVRLSEKGNDMSARQRFSIAAISTALWAICAGSANAQSASTPPRETPLSLVNALHDAFGEHHARAVHTKGVMLEGIFTPSADARRITKEPIFSGGQLPIIARFSVFAGVPDLPDNDDGASPAGFAIKIRSPNGDDFDIEANQHGDFIVATSDEFAVFLRALGAAGKGDGHALDAFLQTHPHARDFLESRTYPASYASAVYFGVNAFRFTNAAGASAFVRYRIVPRVAEHYLNATERKEAIPNYLQDEIVRRLAGSPVVFDWYAQVAGPGDRIEDPSVAWPANRPVVKLGTFTLSAVAVGADALQKTLLFLPGQAHPGVEAADPMLVLRNTAYPISLGQRQ